MILNDDFALKLRNYTSWKRFICLKWIQNKLSTTVHTQFNHHILPVTPFKCWFLCHHFFSVLSPYFLRTSSYLFQSNLKFTFIWLDIFNTQTFSLYILVHNAENILLANFQTNIQFCSHTCYPSMLEKSMFTRYALNLIMRRKIWKWLIDIS